MQLDNINAHTYNNLVSECLQDAEYAVEGWWNQMEALVEQPAIHNVCITLEIEMHPHYVSPQTDHPPIYDKEQLHRMYPESIIGIGKFKIMNTILN